MNKRKNNKNIHKIDLYDEEICTDRVSGGNKEYAKAEDRKYNDLAIDDFEAENPDLAAQCRQLLPKSYT